MLGCTDVCREQKSALGVFFCLIFFFEPGSFTVPGSHQFVWSGWPTVGRGPSKSLQHWHYEGLASVPSFYSDPWVPASTVVVEPSPTVNEFIFIVS